MNDKRRLSRKCYYVCIGLWGIGLIAYIILRYMGISVTELWPYPCAMFEVIGIYCPGCGGTRAVESFLCGNIFQSIINHPLVVYTALLTIIYMISHTLNIVTKGRVKAMIFRTIYLYLMLMIIFVHWLIKNFFLITNGEYPFF